MVETQGTKQLNFELNLLPIISVLAVCVCFLLMTAVWAPLGQVSVQQGLGEKFFGPSENPPTVFASLNAGGNVVFMLKDLGTWQRREIDVAVNGAEGQFNWSQIERTLNAIRSKYPQIETAIVMPNSTSKYNNVIQMMDHLKQAKISNVGLSPF